MMLRSKLRSDIELPQPLVYRGQSTASTNVSVHQRITILNDYNAPLHRCFARVYSFRPLFPLPEDTFKFPERNDQLYWLQSGPKEYVTIASDSSCELEVLIHENSSHSIFKIPIAGKVDLKIASPHIQENFELILQVGSEVEAIRPTYVRMTIMHKDDAAQFYLEQLEEVEQAALNSSPL